MKKTAKKDSEERPTKSNAITDAPSKPANDPMALKDHWTNTSKSSMLSCIKNSTSIDRNNSTKIPLSAIVFSAAIEHQKLIETQSQNDF